MPDPIIHPASFRDPSGFVFQWNGTYYRQVNKVYADNYNLLMSSGLYKHLTGKKLLIEHSETNEVVAQQNNWYKTLQPVQLQHVTYPYEWCLDQLKDAALITLTILKDAVDHGMIIKDATPYNIQFYKGAPLFIDTLSFEKYDADNAWVAYRQFCNLFLFPLYLEHYLKTDIQKTLIVYPDGIPVDITSKLLPLRSRASLGVWLHVYLQNTVTRNADAKKDGGKFNKKKLLNLIDHLEKTIAQLRGGYRNSRWNNYYTETISSRDYLAEKEKIFSEMADTAGSGIALDLGANDGYFTNILAQKKMNVIAVDSDSQTICRLYRRVRENEVENITPLVMDIANPSPSTGFNNKERPQFHQRFKPDLVVALALVHHLVIGRNISLPVLASWFNDTTHNKLIIEFVPKEDEKVQLMLASRKDVFDNYNNQQFEQHFLLYFTISRRENIPGSHRVIYLMEKR